MPSPTYQVLDLLRDRHDARKRTALKLAGRIKGLADGYAVAVDHAVASQIASKPGVVQECPGGRPLREAVAALRVALSELPTTTAGAPKKHKHFDSLVKACRQTATPQGLRGDAGGALDP